MLFYLLYKFLFHQIFGSISKDLMERYKDATVVDELIAEKAGDKFSFFKKHINMPVTLNSAPCDRLHRTNTATTQTCRGERTWSFPDRERSNI